MTLNSTSRSTSILENGRLKPGIYKIQNLHSETYLDIIRHSKELCCRPAQDLEDGDGFWEIKSLGAGYTVQRVEPGRPEQFCAPMEAISNGTPIYVTAYPVAWRVEVVNDGIHRGFEYVRFCWGSTKKIWDLHRGLKDNGTKLHIYNDVDHPFQTWRLITARVEGVFTPSQSESLGSLPPYGEDTTGQSSTRTYHAESEIDDFGTIVTEVTTSIITTRKKYRVQDA